MKRKIPEHDYIGRSGPPVVVSHGKRSGFMEIWLFDEDISDVEPLCQAEEVSEAKWAAKSEILGMLDAGVFLSHLSPRLAELD